MSSIFVLVSKILCLIHSRCSLHLLNGEISYVELHKTFSVFNHCELLSFLFLFFFIFLLILFILVTFIISTRLFLKSNSSVHIYIYIFLYEYYLYIIHSVFFKCTTFHGHPPILRLLALV